MILMRAVRKLASRYIAVIVAAGLMAAPSLAFADAPPTRAEFGTRADTMFAVVTRHAERLASAPHVAPDRTLPAVFEGLDYDAYRKLRPLPETTRWGEAGNPFGVLPLPRGGLYREAVGVHLIGLDGRIETLTAAPHVDFVDYAAASEADRAELGLSGWRAISRPGVAGDGYEFAVFQGGTYFRAVGKGDVYGVSARALALGAGEAAPEEFPRFTDFWIFEPRRTDDSIEVIALADSERATAAFRFVLRPGSAAAVDVMGEIHPRVDLSEVGVAPLSSMYLRGPADSADTSDTRPQVHDSEGLSIIAANGEHVWRPLANPAQVQVSSFAGTPMRFGLEQRSRTPEAYVDGEARYERRPSVWIEPQGDWGAGEVRLLEIPTTNEYADNIAAFWRPAEPLAAGKAHRIAYRLHFDDAPAAGAGAQVIATHIEPAPESTDTHRITIDFEGGQLGGADALLPDVWATSGAVSNIRVTRAAKTRARLSFDLAPGAAQAIELHAALVRHDLQLTETWLFRWTPE
jgi:glucans biosynthesis protein